MDNSIAVAIAFAVCVFWWSWYISRQPARPGTMGVYRFKEDGSMFEVTAVGRFYAPDPAGNLTEIVEYQDATGVRYSMSLEAFRASFEPVDVKTWLHP